LGKVRGDLFTYLRILEKKQQGIPYWLIKGLDFGQTLELGAGNPGVGPGLIKLEALVEAGVDVIVWILLMDTLKE